jgi:hypothetical protein
MDRQTFLDWFGGEYEIYTESDAREFIVEMSAENGADVSEKQMAQYLAWLREENIIE